MGLTDSFSIYVMGIKEHYSFIPDKTLSESDGS